MINSQDKQNDNNDDYEKQIFSIRKEEGDMADFLKDTATISNPNLNLYVNLNDDIKSDIFIKNITSDLKSEFTDDSSVEINIPFNSQVSFFISQSKKKCSKLENNKKS